MHYSNELPRFRTSASKSIGREIARCCFVLIAGVLVNTPVRATSGGFSIGVNFGADEPLGEGAGTLAPADLAGVSHVRQSNWNNTAGAAGVLSALAAELNGVPVQTGASVEWTSANTWASHGSRGENNNAFTAPDRALMTGYLDTGSASESRITISNLPAEMYLSGFDVYVYALGGVSGRGGAYWIEDASGNIVAGPKLGSSPLNPDSFVQDTGEDHNESGTYLQFESISGSNITVVASTIQHPLGFLPRAPINAIQLVAREAALTNSGPVVELLSPTDGSSHLGAGFIHIEGILRRSDKTITKVEYFADDRLIATEASGSIDYAWMRPAPGEYDLVVKVYAEDQMYVSRRIRVTVNKDSNAPVRLPAALLNKTFYLANAQQIFRELEETGQDRFLASEAFFAALVGQVHRDIPEIDPEGLETFFAMIRPRVEAAVPLQRQSEAYEPSTWPEAVGQAFLEALPDLKFEVRVGRGTLTVPVGSVIKNSVDRVTDFFIQQERIRDLKDSEPRVRRPVSKLATEVAAELYDVAASKPAWKRLIDSQLKGAVRVAVGDAASRIYAQNKQLQQGVTKGLRQLMDENGEMKASVESLKEQVSQSMETVQSVIEQQSAILSRIEADSAAEIETRNHKETINGAKSGVFILGTLIGFSDAELGHKVNVIGTSAIDIADSLVRLGNLSKISWSSVVLTGNILGAVMNIFSLFDTGPSADELILQQLARIEKTLNKLRKEMHQRFDRVDKTLNAMYSDMMNQFARIDFKLGRLDGSVSEVQRSLFEIHEKLNRLENDLRDFVQTAERRRLLAVINGGVDYFALNGSLLPVETFSEYENELYSWAVDFSGDSVESAQPPTGMTDLEVLKISDGNIETHLNILAEFAKRLGVPLPVSGDLPNPKTWTLAAEAYALIGREVPALAAKRNRAAEVRAPGLRLASFIRGITLIDVGGSTRPNTPLFERLFQNYLEKVSLFSRELEQLEVQVKQDAVVDAYLRSFLLRLDLWGGTNQIVTNYTIKQFISGRNFLSLDNARGVTAPLAAPSGFESLLPNVALLFEILGLGQVQLNYADYNYVSLDKEVMPCGLIFYEYTRGKLRVAIRGSVGSNIIFYRDYIHPSYTVSPGSKDVRCVDDWSWAEALSDHWTEAKYGPLRDTIVARSVEKDPAAVANSVKALSEAVQKRLVQLQMNYYSELTNHFNLAGSAFSEAAANVEAAKRLIRCFTLLGLSKSIQSDERLHSLLYGTESLPGRDELFGFAIDALDAVSKGEERRIDFSGVCEERAQLLKNIMMTRLHELNALGQEERLASVEAALNKLERLEKGLQLSPGVVLDAVSTPTALNLKAFGSQRIPFSLEESTDLKFWRRSGRKILSGQALQLENSEPGTQLFFRLVAE